VGIFFTQALLGNHGTEEKKPMTFKEILAKTELENLKRIESRAQSANAIAKGLHGNSRQLAYAVKHKSIARAVELGARLSEVSLGERSIICGVQFPKVVGGRRLHIPLDAAGSAKEVLLKQAGGMIGPTTYDSVRQNIAARRCA
jgi:hypothetical protein